MKLDVLAQKKDSWYAAGLEFTCSQCGNCCTGGPGFVWISAEEITRLAAYMKLAPEQVIERYCRNIHGRYSLTEHRNARSELDCVFLKEERTAHEADGQTLVHTKRSCTIYPVRPLQCRTWPFWESNLTDPEIWNEAAVRCHGMNRGRKFASEEMEALRDARDWPENPPTSGKL